MIPRTFYERWCQKKKEKNELRFKISSGRYVTISFSDQHAQTNLKLLEILFEGLSITKMAKTLSDEDLETHNKVLTGLPCPLTPAKPNLLCSLPTSMAFTQLNLFHDWY